MSDGMTATSNWRAGHEPDQRNHCQVCSLRWPCDWVLLCEELEDAESTGRAAVRALAAIRSRSVWGVHTSPATSCCRCALDCEIDAMLATDTATRWRAESEEGQG